MTSRVLIGGEFVVDRGYTRGPMIVYGEREWRRRVRKGFFRHQAVWVWMLYPVLLLFPLAHIIDEFRNPSQIINVCPAILVIVVVTMTWVLLTVVLRYIRGRPPVVGLYERGFQHNRREFLPFEEIRRVELDDPDVMRIVLQRGKVIEWGPWRRVMVVLGEEGVKELTRRVRGIGWAW